jgi:tetratricopeptide (TPR) repeat protein
MRPKHVWIGFLFNAAGFLLSAPGFYLRFRLGIDDWTVRLLVDAQQQPTAWSAFVSYYLIALFLVCFVTGWGLIQGRRWSRWAGIAASIGLLPIFPWFTAAGVVGLCVLLFNPPQTHDAGHDFTRLRARPSPWTWLVSLVTTSLWIAACGRLTLYARSLGLPAANLGGSFWPILLIGGFTVICVHECGHALAAWAVGFRFRSICVGPLVTWRDPHGQRHFRFDWKRFPLGGGYMGSVPTSERSVRLNQILVVFAGPFLSLNAGLLLFLVFLQAPGSAWEDHWRIAGYTSLLFLADFLGNLIPAGYSDGTILLHLLLWTPKGREYSSAWLSGKHTEEAVRSRAKVDYESEVQLRRRLLDESLAHGDRPSLELALKYYQLGLAQVNALQAEEAERTLLRSLEIFGQCPGVKPLVEANSWCALHQVYRLQHRARNMRDAAGHVRAAFEKCKAGLSKVEVFQALVALVQLDAAGGDYLEALQEIEQALALCPSGPKYMLKRATLFGELAECEFYVGTRDAALDAVAKALEILDSSQIPKQDQVHAIATLGLVGNIVWNAGRNEQALAIFSDCVRRYEQHGVVGQSVRFRILSCELLRSCGRLAEAEARLPADENLPSHERRAVITARSNVQLRLGRIDEALAGFELALCLCKEDAKASPKDIGSAECLVAEGLLHAGRLDEAEELAQHARDVLLQLGHPNAAGALITLALVQRERNHRSPESDADRALEIIVQDPLGKPGTTARWLESEANGLEHFGWIAMANRFRQAAEAQWSKVGGLEAVTVK